MKFTAIAQCFKTVLTRRSIVTFAVLTSTLYLAIPLHVLAAVYYVDNSHPQASDSNAGTSESAPWLTIQKAGATMVAGDTVLVKSGTYDSHQAGCDFNDPGIFPANSGAPGNPITFKVMDGHSVLLITSSPISNCAAIGADEGKDYITIDGFEVSTGNSKGITGHKASNFIVKNNTIHNVFHLTHPSDNTSALGCTNCDNGLIQNNLMYDIHNKSETENATCIKFYGSINMIVENNECYDTVSGMRNKAGGSSNIFRYNYIHDVSSNCIYLATTNSADASNNQAYGNVCYRASGSGGGKMDGNSSSTNRNPKFYNNTIVNSGNCLSAGVDSENPNREVYNNICYNSNASKMDGSGFDICDYNDYFGVSSACGGNSITSNPQFVGTTFTSPLDVQLQATSPAIGTGRFGANMGAYATGTECIGLLSACAPGIRPKPPVLQLQ